MDGVIVSANGDWAPHSRSVSVSTLFSLNGDFSRDGFVFRWMATLGEYDYRTAGTTVDVDEHQFDVMLGYQKSFGFVTTTAYIGVDYQNYDLSPDDPDNPVRGNETGLKVVGELETAYEAPLYLRLDAAYSTAFDHFTSDLRVGYNMKWLVVGVEGAYYRIESFDTERLGGFATFRFHFTPSVPAELTVNAGHQFVEGSGNGVGDTPVSTKGGEGTYGGVSFSLAF